MHRKLFHVIALLLSTLVLWGIHPIWAEVQYALQPVQLEPPPAEITATASSEETVVPQEQPAEFNLVDHEESSAIPKQAFGDWYGYNSQLDDSTWIAGDDFGIFSWEDHPTLEIDEESSILFGTGFHFLDGPNTPDLPPRLFDFQLAFQTRQMVAEGLIVDFKTSIGAFSDFEGSARKGIRFPGHAVTYYEWHPGLVTVFGVDVLDRDDISLLPVGGFVWKPNENLICECVFPRPTIQVQFDSGRVAYWSAELGGGTWAIERTDLTNDNVTYRDYRVAVGIRSQDNGSAFELGWAFDRSLEFRSGVGDGRFDDALLLRFRKYY